MRFLNLSFFEVREEDPDPLREARGGVPQPAVAGASCGASVLKALGLIGFSIPKGDRNLEFRMHKPTRLVEQ